MRMTAAYRRLQIEIEDKAKRFQLGVRFNAGYTWTSFYRGTA